MKGITIIVILSVVWSIVSAIIEKKKAAAKKAISASPQPTVATEWSADPVKVKIESLQRRKKSKQAVPDPPRRSKGIDSIKPLHVEDYPLPPVSKSPRKADATSRQLAVMLKNKRNIRTAIVLSEILSKPIALRV
jgi:hypothetical protein